MKRHLVLNQWFDWFVPGDTNDTRLFHSDASDYVRVCPPQLGQGYFQEIPLREDLSIRIIDYTLKHELFVDTLGDRNCLKFQFQLAGKEPGYSCFSPDFGTRDFDINLADKRIFLVEVIFKATSFSTYFHQFVERLSPPLQQLSKEIVQSIYQYYIGKPIAATAVLERIVNYPVTSEQPPFEQILPASLYTKFTSIDCARRCIITTRMYNIIEQILNCPYRSLNRCKYLERKALNLVALYLDNLVKPQSNQLQHDDLTAIYQAEESIRTNLENPPPIKILTRQVGLNRLKLNQGFHQVYHTTPFGYLKKCRLAKARRLLMTSELSVEQIASTVGYTSRRGFATAFYQEFGLNPKKFQIQALNLAS